MVETIQTFHIHLLFIIIVSVANVNADFVVQSFFNIMKLTNSVTLNF